MAKIEVQNDKTRAIEEVQGSDGRMNTTARNASRAYYNARDEGQFYNLPFNHPSAADGEYSVYLKNTSSETLVIHNIEVNSDDIARFKLWEVTGTGANGVARVGKNTNLASPKIADITALHDGSGTTISGLTVAGEELGDVQLVAGGHGEFRVGDILRLAKGDAIAVELETGTTTPDVFGVITFYFE